jgi:hypothetical protein
LTNCAEAGERAAVISAHETEQLVHEGQSRRGHPPQRELHGASDLGNAGSDPNVSRVEKRDKYRN